jgi:uncharacterized protein YjbI with pentapeptide repeats
MVTFMGQITVRGLSVDLPARVPVLELKDVTLVTGKIGKVRTGETSRTGTQVRSVEFAGCELGSMRWTGGKISRTRFSDCQLVGARFEDVTLDHVLFAGCKMDYAMLSRIRAAGPVMFTGCSLREAEFADCHLTLASFGPGRYPGCDLRDNDLATVSGVHYRKKVILDRAQLMQLAEALAAQLSVTFGDSLEDSASPAATSLLCCSLLYRAHT